MTTLLLISFLLFAAYIVVATLKLGEMPERFVNYSDVWMWPWRIAWFVAMFEKSEVGVSIQYAEGSISEFAAYYENLTDKLLYYAFALTNDSVEGGFRAAYTVEFSPSILFPSGDTLTASGDVFLPFG